MSLTYLTPTSSDYAQCAAEDAQKKTQSLERRVATLEAQMQEILSHLELPAPKASPRLKVTEPTTELQKRAASLNRARGVQ